MSTRRRIENDLNKDVYSIVEQFLTLDEKSKLGRVDNKGVGKTARMNLSKKLVNIEKLPINVLSTILTNLSLEELCNLDVESFVKLRKVHKDVLIHRIASEIRNGYFELSNSLFAMLIYEEYNYYYTDWTDEELRTFLSQVRHTIDSEDINFKFLSPDTMKRILDKISEESLIKIIVTNLSKSQQNIQVEQKINQIPKHVLIDNIVKSMYCDECQLLRQMFDMSLLNTYDVWTSTELSDFITESTLSIDIDVIDLSFLSITTLKNVMNRFTTETLCDMVFCTLEGGYN